MSTFKVAIVKTEEKKNGTVNVKIRISHNQAVRYLSTKINVISKYFDEKTGLIRPGGPYTRDEVERWNRKLQIDLATVIQKAESQRNLRFMDINTLMTVIRDKHQSQDLFALIDGRIERYAREGNINYKGAFEATKNRVEEFSGVKTLPFESINVGWLIRLEQWMRSKSMSSNSIGIHMRNIRTIFNQAINMDLVDVSSYPFRKYRIPREATTKRNLTVDEIRKIIHMEIKEPLKRYCRDMWVLMLYLIGINMKDLAFIKQIDDGRIMYIRSKGKKPYSIKVYPEAQIIIDKYRGSQYLLNIMDNYSDYRTATKRINYKLKDIAKELKISKPVSTYYTRHSFATISSYLGIQKDDIAYALGHSIGNEITAIYIDFNQERIDRALRAVIDTVTAPLSE